MKHPIRSIIVNSIPLIFTSLLCSTLASAQIPALLPSASSVPVGEPMAIDGVWQISSIKKRIRFDGGRAVAVDPWLHLFTLSVEPNMVVIQNLFSPSAGRYVGDDLPLMGKFEASLQGNGELSVKVAGLLGPVAYRLTPAHLDDQRWFDQEIAAASGRPPQRGYPDPGRDQPGYDEPEYDDPGYDSPGYQEPEQPRPAPPRFRPPVDWKPAPQPVAGDFTPGCGGEAQIPCNNRPAKRVGKAKKLGCPGKNLHLSLRNGGECWRCPANFKRTAQSIDGPKACAKKFFVGPYRKASYVRSVWGCPKNQFHIARNGGQCMACPKGYKTLGVAGVDSLQCTIKPQYKCDRGLIVAKKPPGDNPLANLVGSNKSKLCGLPFNIVKEAGKDVVKLASIHFAIKQLRLEILAPTPAARALRKALAKKRWASAWDHLQQLSSFGHLKKIARESQHQAITVGLSGDIQAIVGSNVEVGLAVNVNGNGGFKPYRTAGFSKGIAIGLDGGVSIGVWRSSAQALAGPSQGVAVSVGGTASGGAGVWYSYYTPGTRGQQYMGLTVSGGVGLGVEIGEYNEVWTELL